MGVKNTRLIRGVEPHCINMPLLHIMITFPGNTFHIFQLEATPALQHTLLTFPTFCASLVHYLLLPGGQQADRKNKRTLIQHLNFPTCGTLTCEQVTLLVGKNQIELLPFVF